MQRVKIGFISSLLSVIILLTAAFTNAAPLSAIAMNEGRTYDQAHNTGYIDWSGSAQYVVVTHRDGSSLPPEEGGASCGSSCTEWVTRLGNGGVASGAFDRDVSYFEVMVEFTPDSSVGSATLRACSAVSTWYLYNNGGSLPGYVSMVLTVPAGCRSWSISASGGYVDFRSVDVNYIGPPSTPTFTSTPLPTYTPTFTPTFTPTNTPSPTPTPLPPVIVGQVVCDLWGDAGWCRGAESLELTASDPQGFDVTISGDLNGNPFTCGSACGLPLPEGRGTASYLVTSTSGRTASGSSAWQRDSTPPNLNIVLPPLDGRNGWYVSEVDVSATATDAISGLYSLSGSTDNGTTWVLFPIHLTDGVHPVVAHAQDVAGNEGLESEAVHVDTVPPISQFTSHSNGEVVQGSVLLTGSLEDMTSGTDGGELSIDGGITWQAVSMGTGDTWSFTWQSNEVPNGQYTLQMRGMDQAGNVGDPASITLVVDNGPPAVSITERWWIWEAGELKVSPNHFPIVSVQVTIRDPHNRWPAVVLSFDPDKGTDSLSWNRRFADGTLAPSGEYPVVAVACDIHDLCGRDTGIIMIPTMATSTATITPSPTATMTQTPHATSTATQKPPTPTPVLVTPSPEKPAQPVRTLFPLWQLIGLLGLFMVIASASVVDPRPAALDRLRETFKMKSARSENNSHKNKQD